MTSLNLNITPLMKLCVSFTNSHEIITSITKLFFFYEMMKMSCDVTKTLFDVNDEESPLGRDV